MLQKAIKIKYYISGNDNPTKLLRQTQYDVSNAGVTGELAVFRGWLVIEMKKKFK